MLRKLGASVASRLLCRPAAPLTSSHMDLRFHVRHVGPSREDEAKMLSAVGSKSLGELVEEVAPPSDVPRPPHDLKLTTPAGGMREPDALASLRATFSGNTAHEALNVAGGGYHGTVTPAAVKRNVLEDPGWYTPYTPYQAELAQGRCESLLNYQTAIAGLTGLPRANASLLDEATAAAEAMGLAASVWRRNQSRARAQAARKAGGAAAAAQAAGNGAGNGAGAGPLADGAEMAVVLDAGTLAQTVGVVRTRAHGTGVEVRVAEGRGAAAVADAVEALGSQCALALFQFPCADGTAEDLEGAIARCKAAGAMVAVAADPLSLAMIKPPGDMGADVALGSTQRFGVPMGFGGPHAAYFAAREDLVRQFPGRVMGVSRDRLGGRSYRMALQTREQHIRRERATSNICTAQALLANVAAFYLVHHGPDGLRQIAADVHATARAFADAVVRGDAGDGCRLAHSGAFFDTVAVDVAPRTAGEVAAALSQEHAVNAGVVGGSVIRVAFDETHDTRSVARVADALRSVVSGGNPGAGKPASAGPSYASLGEAGLARESAFMEHPVFRKYRSETALMRYMRYLQSKDYSLVHGIVPLGSCTMKLNAAAEMEPISWPEVNAIHPFAPPEQTRGYERFLRDLEADLAELTGFSRVSFQPNAGSQGEYAGLRAIAAYHESRGDGAVRDVCLIPRSAHGTNPASAVMAGMRVVTIEDDADGCVDMDDLRAKIAKHEGRVSALMITFPTTFGVFIPLREITELIHSAGGLVYLDGANFNALSGVARPGDLGADVCHLNLHKTFAIPHGGGGPGMGPIGVNERLAPFLPSHDVVDLGLPESYGAVSAAPHSSASILPITAMYLRLLGIEGITRSTEVAILNANYMATRLRDHYDIAFLNKNGRCAHEFIVDLRKFKSAAGVTATDIAKRLQDYGLHAPTMSWPLPDSLMIEPTESESLEEIDRLVDALISIRAEIDKIAGGAWPREDNPLVNAPHPLAEVTAEEWSHPYPRDTAAYPAGEWQRMNKFWPATSRVDDVWGDKKLVTIRADDDLPPI